MCIICVKNKGVEMPTQETIRTMFLGNSDGAGYMYLDPNSNMVKIRKGYMTVKSLFDSLQDLADNYDLTEIPMVLHFRIGTAGGNIPENTHPFPLTENMKLLQKRRLTCNIGIVHNGIIPIKTSATNISDTMEYITSQLAPLYKMNHGFYNNDYGKEMIKNFTGSKWAFLDSTGDIATIGTFIEEPEGLLYSNSTYKPHSYTLAKNYSYMDAYDGYSTSSYYYDADTKGYKKKGAKDYSNFIFGEECEETDYIINDNGDLFACADSIYYIDRNYNVYEYDYNYDTCTKITGTCYTEQGLPKEFDTTLADWIEIA